MNGFPEELKKLRRWVGYRLVPVEDGGKPKKVPINAVNGKNAQSNNPASWCDYETARAAADQYGYNGIGFMFLPEDGYVGVDVDHCYDPETGAFNETAQKIVVMARFTAELDAIEDLLTKKKIGYGAIRGGVKNRDEEIRRFQNDPDCTVFVGQIQAAGVGITLTAASTMVFFSLDYSMANHTQAMARIHRVGQRNACTYIYLCARNTVDGKVIKALQNKQDLAKALIDDYRAGINPFA